MSVRRHLLKALAEVLVNPPGAISHLFDAVHASRDRRAAAAALLDDGQEWSLELSPAALLRADLGVVPFHAGREKELADLALRRTVFDAAAAAFAEKLDRQSPSRSPRLAPAAHLR